MNAHYIPDRFSSGAEFDHAITDGHQLAGGVWQDPCAVSLTQNYEIGTVLRIGDRSFRYAKFHTAVGELSYAMVNGNIIPTDGAEAAIIGTPVAGDRTITIADTTVRAADYYQGGYCMIHRNPAIAQSALNHDQFRKIIASTAGAGVSVTLTLEYPLTCAPVNTVDAYPSPYSKVCTPGHSASGAEMFVGYAHAFHAAGGFGWVQTWGPVNGHYTGGATEWPGNHGPNDRQCVFSVEGGVRTTKSSGTVVPLASQIAGFVIPCTAADYGSVFFWLTIAP